MLIILAIIATALIVLYAYLEHHYTYFPKKGIIQKKPTLFFGDLFKIILRQRSVPEINADLYNINPDARYVGFYQFLLPTLLIRDPELIKQITVKDFDHFTDHRPFIEADEDVLFAKSLLSLTGEKWKEMRNRLSPAFTSSKMKYMFSLISRNGKQFIEYFLNKNEDIIEVEMRDISTRFANDVIANIVFGFECDSFREPENEFYLMGKKAINFTSLRSALVFFGYILMPKVLKFFKVTFFSPAVNTFFSNLVKENIRSRENLAVKRPDMITLLLEARKNNLKHETGSDLPDLGFSTNHDSDVKAGPIKHRKITDDEIIAQALTFFFAGFDSVAALMSFMAYELAVNTQIQEKLIKEVDAIQEKCNGEITYEALASMKYMDMVVSETLRKYPNAIGTDRVCSKPYTIEPKFPNENAVDLKPGDILFLPIFGIHRDPQYYPEPERFDPERFNDENRHNIHPYTYFPFGIGPRSCIGSRFAMLETKILFFNLLSNFELVPNEKTQIPLKFSRKVINMAPEMGYHMSLKRRDKN